MVHNNVTPLGPREDDGPTADDLAAIEREWPLIEAEMELTAAEIDLLTAARPSELDWRRLRRAEARVMRAALTLIASRRPATLDGAA